MAERKPGGGGNLVARMMGLMANSVENLEAVPMEMLKTMRTLCPDERHGSTSFEACGMKVTLTLELRQRIDAELKRRKAEKKGGGRG